MSHARTHILAAAALLALLLSVGLPTHAFSQGRGGRAPADTLPTLGLEAGVSSYRIPRMELRLVDASQTVAGLLPLGVSATDAGFDFTPSDWLERRDANRYVHLGDLSLRVRAVVSGAPGPWMEASTAADRHPVTPLPPDGAVLAAADLAPTLPSDLPVAVVRSWEVWDGHLVLRFRVTNRSETPVEIGALGIPMVFNNILSGRSLDEAHAVASFHDPYIGNDAGYVQVTRLTGHGPALLVVPFGDTPLEAWNPVLTDPTRRGVTFEGFYEWMAHSRAYAEEVELGEAGAMASVGGEWAEAEPWNPPTSAVLAPEESRSYGVQFLVAPALRALEETLLEAGRPVAVGVPGYVLPMDQEGRLFLRHWAALRSIDVEPAGALTLTEAATTPGGWTAYDVSANTWGRAHVTVTWADGLEQTVHYKVIKAAPDVVDDLGRFLTTEQWFEDPDDPFGRSPSVISYDIEERAQVTEDNRAWIAGLGDEGGSGSWLAAMMKQLVRPDPAEIAKLQRFVDGVLWGGLQYAPDDPVHGERAYGVRKSMFYWEPDSLPPGTYSDDVRYGGWSSWDIQEAMSVGRSYDYPHVAAAWWVLYRLARNHEGLVTNHPWDWYLERAWRTGTAMVEHAGHYAQFGQMDGTVFLLVLQDLQREGWTQQAAALEAVMRERAAVWRALGYPFGSEMPWDSTGQEEVYAWCRYFGFDDKAQVTLNAILGYMPTVPHWGYNGSARRYWDFQYAGKLRRVERQLHHYGSALNAIPVLSEYRMRPDDLYLLRVGYAGMMGALANITREGFAPAAFHAWPSTLRIDGYSGDYGPGFFGHAVNTGTYVTWDDELGWLAFGGSLAVVAPEASAPGPGADLLAAGTRIRVTPRDASRSRVYLAPLGLWLTLDAGVFETVEMGPDGVRVTLAPATPHTPAARLRVERPGQAGSQDSFSPERGFELERGAYVIPLEASATTLVLRRE